MPHLDILIHIIQTDTAKAFRNLLTWPNMEFSTRAKAGPETIDLDALLGGFLVYLFLAFTTYVIIIFLDYLYRKLTIWVAFLGNILRFIPFTVVTFLRQLGENLTIDNNDDNDSGDDGEQQQPPREGRVRFKEPRELRRGIAIRRDQEFFINGRPRPTRPRTKSPAPHAMRRRNLQRPQPVGTE